MNKFIIITLSLLMGYGIVWYDGQQSFLPTFMEWEEWWPLISLIFYLLMLSVYGLCNHHLSDRQVTWYLRLSIYGATAFGILAFSLVLGKVVFGNLFFYLWLQYIMAWFAPSASQVVHVITRARHDSEED